MLLKAAWLTRSTSTTVRVFGFMMSYHTPGKVVKFSENKRKDFTGGIKRGLMRNRKQYESLVGKIDPDA